MHVSIPCIGCGVRITAAVFRGGGEILLTCPHCDQGISVIGDTAYYISGEEMVELVKRFNLAPSGRIVELDKHDRFSGVVRNKVAGKHPRGSEITDDFIVKLREALSNNTGASGFLDMLDSL